MEIEILTILGLIGAYIGFKYFFKQPEKIDHYSEILGNEKYKVKGQWEKD